MKRAPVDGSPEGNSVMSAEDRQEMTAPAPAEGGGEKLSFREARPEDEMLLLSWTNDPETRKNSFNSGPVSPETHHAWFSRRLSDKNCVILIFFLGDEPAGQVRLECENDTARISYSVAREHRGKGYGKEMVSLAIGYALTGRPEIKAFRAEVKPDNIPSLRIFGSLGFTEVSSDDKNVCFILVKPEKLPK